jgi:hypothetical protein
LDYSFAWDQVGKLAPGVNFRVRGYQDADPGDPNKSKIYFEKTNYGYQFSPDRTKAKPARNGALAITCSGTVWRIMMPQSGLPSWVKLPSCNTTHCFIGRQKRRKQPERYVHLL